MNAGGQELMNCDNCGGDILHCTHDQKPEMRTIQVDPKDAKPGDKVTATYNGLHGGETTAIVTGTLREGVFGPKELYIVSAWDYVITHGKVRDKWSDVTITREVPVHTRVQAILDLPVGTHFKTSEDSSVFLRRKDDVFNLNYGVTVAINKVTFGTANAKANWPIIIETGV